MSSRSKRQSLKLATKVAKGLAAPFEKYEEKSELQVEFIEDKDVGIVIVGINKNTELIKSTKKHKSKLTESTHQNNHTSKSCKKREKPVSYMEEVLEEEEEEYGIETCEKPKGLYDDEDVAGGKMCSFRTPKKKQGMLQKARESASKYVTDSASPKNVSRTPKQMTPTNAALKVHKTTPKRQSASKLATLKKTPIRTPKNISKETTNSVVSKTPYQLRVRHKKAIQDYRRKEVSEVDSDSDYHSSSESSSESENDESAREEGSSDSSSDSGKCSEELKPSCRRSLRFKPVTSCIKKRGKDFNYVVESEEYFQSRANKSVTSDRNLSRLKTPRLESSTLQGLLTQYSVSMAHQKVLAFRREDDYAMFHRWMFALSQGFSILAYGLGSKFKILQNFHCKMLKDSHVVVINGFFPSLTVKEIVEMIAKDLLGFSHALPSPHSIIDWIENRRWMPRVFIIVHNLDAPMLRCEKTQKVLSRLANLPKVHLVASVDHINCPLLWDQGKLSNFNFMWEDTTSFLPYQEETSYETSLMVQNSGSLALSSLLNVYRSLTHNSRGVFRIILDEHLNENSKKYTGMAFSALYSRCREEMLVTSDLALRTMLTEFIDHQMVKWRQNGENLHIPTDIGVLRQFKQLIQES